MPVAHLGDGGLGPVCERDDDSSAVSLVVLAVDQADPGELADDEARVRQAHVHPLRQLGHTGRPGNPERDERGDVPLSEPAGFAQLGWQLATAPPERKRERRHQRCKARDMRAYISQGNLTINTACVNIIASEPDVKGAEMSEGFNNHDEPRDPTLRAADEDRERVAEILREQHVAGRLDTDELQERLDRCYAAKTYGELHELVADLPEENPVRVAPRPFRWPALALVPLLIAAIALSLGHLLWLVIPLFLFFGRPLLWRRFGWGYAACGVRRRPTSSSYL